MYHNFFVVVGTVVWTQGLHLEPLCQPLFVKGFFEIESQELFALAGLETMILLISAFLYTSHFFFLFLAILGYTQGTC
jgi:hypothetical protein